MLLPTNWKFDVSREDGTRRIPIQVLKFVWLCWWCRYFQFYFCNADPSKSSWKVWNWWKQWRRLHYGFLLYYLFNLSDDKTSRRRKITKIDKFLRNSADNVNRMFTKQNLTMIYILIWIFIYNPHKSLLEIFWQKRTAWYVLCWRFRFSHRQYY